jgi:hypothetical protein
MIFRFEIDESSFSVEENGLDFRGLAFIDEVLLRNQSKETAELSSFCLICLPENPITEQLDRFSAVPRVAAGGNMMI